MDPKPQSEPAKKRKLSRTAKILIALVLFFAAGVVHIAINVSGIFGQSGDLRWVNTGRFVPYTVDAAPVFHGAEGPFFYIVTRDGMRSISNTGEMRWNVMLNLRRPIMVARGQYAAVSESERGRVIDVFDANGRAFNETFDYPIHGFSINEAGFLTVMLQLDDDYVISIFHRGDRSGPFYRRYLRESDNPGIIPVTAAVTSDGRYMALGLLDVNNRLLSRIQFCYTSRDDGWRWGTEGVFYEKTFEYEMLLHMRKTADNRLVAITDAQIAVFVRNVSNDTVEQTVSISLHNRPEQLAFDASGRFAVAMGAAHAGDLNAAPVGTVHIYDASGTLTGTYHAGRRVTHLEMGHGLAIVGTDRNFYAVNLQGEPIWEFIALQEVRDFIFLENSDTVLIAGSARADIWRRQRRRADGADFFGIGGQEQE